MIMRFEIAVKEIREASLLTPFVFVSCDLERLHQLLHELLHGEQWHQHPHTHQRHNQRRSPSSQVAEPLQPRMPASMG